MVRAIARPSLTVLIVAIAIGCHKKRDPDAERVRANLLATGPALEAPLNVDLGGGLIYLGNEVDSTRARPGGSVTVTHYLKVTRKPPDLKFRVSIAADGEQPVAAAPSFMQTEYPPTRWKPGDIIRDRQIVEVPGTWRAPHVKLQLAFELDTPIGRPIPIEAGGDYPVHRASGPIELDGVGGEAAWRAASWSPSFTTATGGRPVPGQARARLLWDDAHLYALIEVVDPNIFSPFTGRDDTLWKADVVEIFIDADRNRRGYVELQVNPRGAIFDAFFPVGRGQEHHFEWNSRLRAGVTVDGTADRRGDRDRGWVVEMAIPHADVVGMAGDQMDVRIPPAVGDRWNLNVVRVDQPGGKGISAATWNPITIRDFHALGRMLTVTFAD